VRDRASHQRNLPKAQHSKPVFWPLRLCPDKLAVIPLFRLSEAARLPGQTSFTDRFCNAPTQAEFQRPAGLAS